MTDEVQLKPCPFCGGEAEITTWHSLGKDGHMVDCKAAAFVGGCVSDAMVQIFGETRQKTIAAWNTRPATSAAQARREALEEWAMIVFGLHHYPEAKLCEDTLNYVEAAIRVAIRAKDGNQ